MATESSAIARLVDAAQNRGMPGPDGIFEPTDRYANPALSQRTGRPPERQSGGAWWLLVVAVVVIGGAVAGGYFLAQQQGDGTQDHSVAAELGTTTDATSREVDPEEVANAARLPPVPSAATTVAPDAASVEEVETELEPAPEEADVAMASKTGFDILVEPQGARVTLDGHAIGVAPLRVRNLLPGVHRIDIEGPEGYFGQHQEFELAAGEAMVLRLALDALDPTRAADASEDEDEDAEPAVTPGRSPKSTKSSKLARKRSRASKKTKAPSAKEEKALASTGKVSLGTLMLGAKPPCDILINGKKTGLVTPQRSIQLPEGVHRVVLVNSKHGIHKSFKVRIKAGRTTRAIQDLTKTL